MISASAFYGEYHGHQVTDLRLFEKGMRPERGTVDKEEEISRGRKQSPLRARGRSRSKSRTRMSKEKETGRRAIWLAGDSSLDNKFWFPDDRAPPVNGMKSKEVFGTTAACCRRDVAYWLNALLEKRGKGSDLFAINASVEESKVESRARQALLPQDRYLKKHIQPNDLLVVSVGGNDIALFPQLPCTVLNMALLALLTPTWCLQRAFVCPCGVLPCDDPLYGCSTGCLSNFCAFPFGYGYMTHLFGSRVQNYLDNVTGGSRPAAIGVCAIYYPDETSGDSWAEHSLSALGYNQNPARLQLLIDGIFRDATSQIKVKGTKIIPIALSSVMDGKNTNDYVARVEPSVEGGEKMAGLFLDAFEARKVL